MLVFREGKTVCEEIGALEEGRWILYDNSCGEVGVLEGEVGWLTGDRGQEVEGEEIGMNKLGHVDVHTGIEAGKTEPDFSQLGWRRSKIYLEELH